MSEPTPRTAAVRPRRAPVPLGLLILAATALGAAEIPVDTTTDDFATNGNCTLREALYAAQLNIPLDGCPAGDLEVRDVVSLGPDTHFVTLGPLLVANSDVTVAGAIPVPNGPTYVTTGLASRIFDLSGDADVVLQRLILFEAAAGTDPDDVGGAVRAVDSSLELVDCVVGGNRAVQGAGVHYTARGEYSLTVRRTRFENNLAETPANPRPYGGGLHLEIRDGADATIIDSAFQENGSSSIDGSGASGAAIWAEASSLGETSLLVVRRTSFLDNALVCEPGTQGDAAVKIGVFSDAEAVLVDLRFVGTDAFVGCHGESTTALVLSSIGSSVTLDRIRFLGNDPGEARRHVLLSASQGATLTATNLLLADGPTRGLQLINTASQTSLGHLTVTGHAERSLFLENQFGGVSVLDNSILWGNGTDDPQLVGPTTLRSNLIGVDPLFVDPAGGDYNLVAGSPAQGAGDRTLPTVRLADAAHCGRISGPQTDAGAYERRGLFADGFDLGDATDWTAPLP